VCVFAYLCLRAVVKLCVCSRMCVCFFVIVPVWVEGGASLFVCLGGLSK